uniref:Uncharacterized protein n=1 Tax=Setaria viridis TaxID=4556 RepID=A0A4U6UBR7_SETVI|nr:hypothetical protein SEVIR_5G044000v2 [Setaria viridis]
MYRSSIERSSIAHWRSGISHYLFDKRVSFIL